MSAKNPLQENANNISRCIDNKNNIVVDEDKENKKPDNDKIQLHWKKDIERRGLGDLLVKANHIALTVSDIGRSLWFYSDVLGLQQIRRPNFDRHGAWLTMGNIELHLILGQPQVPDGKNLIVGHISLETNNIKEVLRRLREMNIPFETNVSVPKGDESEGIVTQFFMRDPDGYYIELCNCDILTDFCFGNENLSINGYNESCKPLVHLSILSKVVVLAEKAKKRNKHLKETGNNISEKFTDCELDHEVDEEKLANLLKRTKIYGDILQGEDEESLRMMLKKSNNDIPCVLAYIKAKHGDGQVFQPPTIFKNNEEKYTPAVLSIRKGTNTE